jgi:hypothetical protein
MKAADMCKKFRLMQMLLKKRHRQHGDNNYVARLTVVWA